MLVRVGTKELGLPIELILNIFAHLDWRDLAALTLVCDALSAVARDDKVWKDCFQRHFPSPFSLIAPRVAETTWRKEFYKFYIMPNAHLMELFIELYSFRIAQQSHFQHSFIIKMFSPRDRLKGIIDNCLPKITQAASVADWINVISTLRKGAEQAQQCKIRNGPSFCAQTLHALAHYVTTKLSELPSYKKLIRDSDSHITLQQLYNAEYKNLYQLNFAEFCDIAIASPELGCQQLLKKLRMKEQIPLAPILRSRMSLGK